MIPIESAAVSTPESSSPPSLAYPAAVTARDTSRAAAVASLVEWVGASYDMVPATAPPGSFSSFALALRSGDPPRRLHADVPRQVEVRDAKAEVRLDERLLHWIYAVSRDASTRDVYGVSEQIGDAAYFGLEAEAFTFLNHSLRIADTFDAARVTADAERFLDDLASGQETYEVGAHIYRLEALGPDTIVLGPGLELHRIESPWAEERFERASELPPNHWAVTATITRRRAYSSGPASVSSFRQEQREKAAVERALLPLRLLHPSLDLNEEPAYRIGTKGCWWPPKREFYWENHWRGGGDPDRVIGFTVHGIEELRALRDGVGEAYASGTVPGRGRD